MFTQTLAFALTAFASLFAIVDPFASLPVYLALTARETEPRRKIIAQRAALTLFVVAFEMMYAKSSATKSTPAEEEDAASRQDIGLMPIGIPLLSGPGAIASSMMLSARASHVRDKVVLIVVMAVVSLVTWVVLRSATGIARVLGRTGMNIIARVMGLILAATAAQFVIDGVRGAFPMLAR